MDDQPQLSSFLHAKEYAAQSSILLSLDLSALPSKQEDASELALLSSLCIIVDVYQEQSYLLDPWLEELVTPLVHSLRLVLRQQPSPSLTFPRTERLARLIYVFTKVRGAKAIVRFFPHEVDDLVSLIQILQDPVTLQSASWELRFILLVWLSVACRLPFDLAQLKGCTEAIPVIGYWYLKSASKERDGAIALLARFYSRQDASLQPFLTTCEEAFSDPSASRSLTSGLLEVLCEILKTASRPALGAVWPTLYRLLAVCDTDSVSRGALVAKYRVKLAGRLALLRLSDPHAEEEVPEEVEVILQEMLEALQDKDTIVRWSASKYIARITEGLPEAFALEMSEAILSSFESNFAELDTSENALQGACFAFGELARRGRIPHLLVDRLLSCVLQALLFDRKRGVQSIGSGVRDAAAYVLWSLARTLRPAQVAPHASQLATRLVSVALFDRDIHIRRAASAAFQESVGRWGIFPHGIDVLRKIDFFTISIRKRAFLEAAPLVAEHSEYRLALIQHILDVGLTHYDPEIRSLAAVSLERIVRLDPAGLAPSLIPSQLSQLATKDTSRLHGVLLSLAALAASVVELPEPIRSSTRSQIFSSISSIAPATRSLRSPLVLSATLQALEESCTAEAPSSATGLRWSQLVHLAGDRGEEDVHQRAAMAMARISALTDYLVSRSQTRQQCAALVLGRIDYCSTHLSRVVEVVNRLIAFVGYEALHCANSVEARRNGIEALSLIVCDQSKLSPLGPEGFLASISAILNGFNDYSLDQRGDVGSWIRIASISAVQRCIGSLARGPFVFFSQEHLDRCVAAVLKQAVERLDNVREVAGDALVHLMELEEAREEGQAVLRRVELFASLKVDRTEWRDVAWASARLLPLLAVPQYRLPLLEGAVLAATRHSSSSPLLDFAASLPATSPPSVSQLEETYSLVTLVTDLSSLARRNFSANRVFIPTLGVLGSLMDAGCLDGLEEVVGGSESLQQVLLLSTRSLAQIKSAPRLTATVKIVVNLLSFPATRDAAADKAHALLTHPAPWLRQHVAEELYGVYGGLGDDSSELETLLIETPWSEGLIRKEEARRVAELLVEGKQ